MSASVSLPQVPCTKWSALPGCSECPAGRCSAGHAGGQPSRGLCMLLCEHYDGPADVRRAMRERAAAIAAESPAHTGHCPDCPRHEDRPHPGIAEGFNWLQAMALAGEVAEDVRAEREAACAACDKVAIDDRGQWCRICGCGTSDDSRRVFNLARFNEGTIDPKSGAPKWGCKHPQRGKIEGKGWRR